MRNSDLYNYKLYESKRILLTKNSNYKINEVEKYDSYLGLMCPYCYTYNIVKFHQTSSILIECDDITLDYTYILRLWKLCSVCDKERQLIQVDPNIVEAISIFNKKGYITDFCCEGHGDGSAYILFKNHDIDKYLYDLPITWYDDLMDRKTYFGSPKYTIRTCIRSDSCNYKEAMLDILEFASSLPYNNKLTILF